MADQNKSNKGPQNVTPDWIDESKPLTAMERIWEQASRETSEYSRIRGRKAEFESTLKDLLKARRDIPGAAEAPQMQQWIDEARAGIHKTHGQLRAMNTSAAGGAESQASYYVQRTFGESHLRGEAGRLARLESTQNSAFSMAHGLSSDEIFARQEDLMAQARTLERGAQKAIRSGIFPRDRSGKINLEAAGGLENIYSQRDVVLKQLAETNAAVSIQRGLGIDPGSKLQNTLKTYQDASSFLGVSDIVSQRKTSISRGGEEVQVDLKNVYKEMEAEARTLTDSLKKLNGEADRGGESLESLRKKADESAQNYEKLKQAQQAGGGGYSGAQVASALAGGFGAAATTIREIGINQRMGQVANIAGFANIENQKYDTYRKAAAGDIASQLMMGQFGAAEAFGRDLGGTQKAVLGAQIAGGVSQAAAGGFQVAEGATGKVVGITGQVLGTGGLSTQEVMSGIQNVAQGTSTAAIAGMDMYRGVSQGQTQIQATQAQLEARRALQYVGAQQLQGFRDFSVGQGVAAMQMGRRGGAFLDRTVNKDNMNAMVNARISPEQFNQMSEFGARNIGSTFNESQIYAARGLERSGFGTMQDNMQRMASLAAAGSNNPQAGLGSVLEAAFTKGLDSSKAISAMVENTGTMAASSAGRAAGLDTTAAAATLLGAAVNTKDPNQEYAVNRAASIQQRVRDISTNVDMSFAGQANTARIAAMGISGTGAISAGKLDIETLNTIRNMSPQKQAEFYLNRGINVSNVKGGAAGFTNQMIDLKQMELLEGGGIGFATMGAKERTSILNKIRGGRERDITKKEREDLGQAAVLGGFADADELIRVIKGVKAKNSPNAKKESDEAMGGKLGSEAQKIVDDMRTLGFKQLSQAALEATKGFKTATDTLKALGDLSKQIERIGDTGGEGKFKGAAADAAGTFGKSTLEFKDAVGVFNAAVDKMATKAGLSAEDRDKAHANREINKVRNADRKSSTAQRGHH